MELKEGMKITKNQLKDAVESLEEGQVLMVEFETEDDAGAPDNDNSVATLSDEEKARYAQEVEELLSPEDIEDMLNGGTGEVSEDEE